MDSATNFPEVTSSNSSRQKNQINWDPSNSAVFKKDPYELSTNPSANEDARNTLSKQLKDIPNQTPFLTNTLDLLESFEPRPGDPKELNQPDKYNSTFEKKNDIIALMTKESRIDQISQNEEFMKNACENIHDDYYRDNLQGSLKNPNEPLCGASLEDFKLKEGDLEKYFVNPAHAKTMSTTFRGKLKISDLKPEYKNEFLQNMGKDPTQKAFDNPNAIILNTIARPGKEILTAIQNNSFSNTTVDDFTKLQKNALLHAATIATIDQKLANAGLGGIGYDANGEHYNEERAVAQIAELTHIFWALTSGWGGAEKIPTAGLSPSVQKADIDVHKAVIKAGFADVVSKLFINRIISSTN